MKLLKSFLLIYFLFCSKTLNAQNSSSDLEDLQGVWIRQDLIQSLQETHSIFETREIMEKKGLEGFLTLAIPEESYRADTLMLCIGSFYSPMSWSMLASVHEITKDKYYIARDGYYITTKINEEGADKELLLFKIKNNVLDVIIKNTKTQKRNTFTFQKVSNEKNNCYGHIGLSYFYALKGNYHLLDANGKVLNENIWFDGKGNTNFPKFPHFNIYSAWGSSINNGSARRMGDKIHVGDKTGSEKREMLKNGAIDKEDLLILRKNKKDEFVDTQQFIIQKTVKGFNIYNLKERSKMKWQLLYKKDLVYKLERREGEKKKPYIGK